MPPLPHGPGLYGALHSHDPQYPDDEWNLYAMLDRDQTTALNVTRPENAVAIFKPFVHRLSASPEIISDADEEVIVIARFTSPVHIRKIMIVGGGDEADRHPSSMKCYVNQENVDFTNISNLRPSQEFALQVNPAGTIEIITTLQKFSNVTTLTIFFPSSFGHEQTAIRYIGLQGEHTHYRREAVNTTYELLCTGQDIVQPEGNLKIGGHMH